MLGLLWQQLRQTVALFYNNAVICLVVKRMLQIVYMGSVSDNRYNNLFETYIAAWEVFINNVTCM